MSKKAPCVEAFDEPCGTYYKIFSGSQTGGFKYRFLSPFEFKNTLIKEAKKRVGEKNILNAGRGNPNFFSTMPRLAFALLTTISTEIGEDLCCDTDLGFIPPTQGIAEEFYRRLNKHRGKPEGKFLKQACEKMRWIAKMKKDDFIHNLVISTIGCFYPSPPRVQQFVEPVLLTYMDNYVYRSKRPLVGKAKIMPTEGAAAAILYVFNSLKYNGLVVPGDTIGILTPIFSPYLEIPTLENYKLKQVCVTADAEDNWEISDAEAEQIGDPAMRALFLVNPTNPTARSLSASTVRRMAAVVRKKNPNLIILEDNVYAPYVKEFNDFFNVLPKNTIGVFSFSKYFGVTGWRLGTIIMHNTNIIDNTLLKEVSEEVHGRYKMISTKPSQIKFIDRILADSRQVAEAHVAGLSTPQQTLMTLFATYDMLDKGRVYSKTLDALLLKRMKYLLTPIAYPHESGPLDTNYYIIIDILKAVDGLTGCSGFSDYLKEHRDPLEFLLNLAKHYGVILLPAVGFAGPFWGVRVSLANLETDDYNLIGESLRCLLDDYYEEFKKWEAREKRLKRLEEKKK